MLLTQTARAAPAPRCYLVLPDVDPKCSEPRSLQFHRHYCRALDRLCMELICSSESGSHGGGSDKLLLSLFSSYTVYQEYFTDKFSEVLNLAPSIVFFGSRSNKGPRSAADNEQTRFVYVDTENMGVHHSKYIILFTEKFLHVIVSTSNLVPQTCIDMCWTQSFPRLAHSTSAPACLKGADSNSTRNDFGLILENFIEMQSRHAVGFDARALIDFIGSSANLVNHIISETFDFRNTQAMLVPVLPGKYTVLDDTHLLSEGSKGSMVPPKVNSKCRSCLKEDISKREDAERLGLSYGSHRVRMCLNLQTKNSFRTLLPEDRLILQPTSIGMGTRNDFISEMLDSYMPRSGHDSAPSSFREDDDTWRLIWPTRRFVHHSEDLFRDSLQAEENAEKTGVKRPSSSDSDFIAVPPPTTLATATHHRNDPEEESPLSSGHFFMHSQTLALMEPDILQQMRTYVPNGVAKALGQEGVSPHIKSYTRVYSSPYDTAAISSLVSNCTCTPLAWCLMTSACLSKGAQGQLSISTTECKKCTSTDVVSHLEFRNFELGVMLHSNSETETLYRALDAECPVHGLLACLKEDETESTPIVESECIIPLPFELLGGEDYYCSATASFEHMPYLSNSKDLMKYGVRNSLPTQFSPVKLKRSRTDGTVIEHRSIGMPSSVYSESSDPTLSPEIILRAQTTFTVTTQAVSASVSMASSSAAQPPESDAPRGHGSSAKPSRLRIEDFLCDLI